MTPEGAFTLAEDALDAVIYAGLRAAFFERLGRSADAAFWQAVADEAQAQYDRLSLPQAGRA